MLLVLPMSIHSIGISKPTSDSTAEEMSAEGWCKLDCQQQIAISRDSDLPGYQSCYCRENTDKSYTAVYESSCEFCDPASGWCFVLSYSATYFDETRGNADVRECKTLTRSPKIGERTTICVQRNRSFEQSAFSYSVYGAVCPRVNGTDEDCLAFDCSGVEEGAIFDFCDEEQGYIGIFQFEPDVTLFGNRSSLGDFEKGRCSNDVMTTSGGSRVLSCLKVLSFTISVAASLWVNN